MKNLLRIGTLILVFSLTSCVEDMPEPDGISDEQTDPRYIDDSSGSDDN